MRREPDLPTSPPRPGTIDIVRPGFRLMKVPAPPQLAGLVHDISLYREFSGAPIRQTETASLVVPLLIGFAEPFEIALGRMPRAGDDYQSFTSGLTLKPVHIRSAGGCSCLEITLTPLGARRLFGLPMREITERMVRLDDLGDRAFASLRQRLGEEPDWTRRLAIAEVFLMERLAPVRAPCPATEWAFGAILATRGRLSVARIAGKLDWSRKHLAHRFHEEIGLGPKAVSRIARFTAAQTMARTHADDGWAGIAAECGYADQAHLVREFKELAGATPSAWRSGDF